MNIEERRLHIEERRTQDLEWDYEKWKKLSMHEKLNYVKKSLLDENEELEELINDLLLSTLHYFPKESDENRQKLQRINSLIGEMKMDLNELFFNLPIRIYDAESGDEI